MENSKFVILKQLPDPLEYGICTFPIPSKIGIPCLPCEQANQFKLYITNEDFEDREEILDLEEESN